MLMMLIDLKTISFDPQVFNLGSVIDLFSALDMIME